IFDYARIASDRLQLLEAPFPLGDVVAGIVQTARGSAGAKGLSLLLTVDPEVPHWVVGDEVRFTQIVRNLLTNAIRYSDSGNITIALTCTQELFIRCAVKDQGIGIRDEAIPTLFEPFTQAHRKRAGGSGLGLAVCARLTELMGGTVSVESEVGAGSTFTVVIPLEATTAPESPRPRVGHTGAGGQRILVVEDSPVNQLLAKSQIHNLGMEAIVADAGEDALEMLEGPDCPEFDAILMDWNLPGITGLETASQIRSRNLVEPTIPIIAMTANALTGDRERCLEAGMDDFLAKPVSAGDMTTMLSKWLVASGPPALVGARHNASVDEDTLSELAADLDDPAIVEGLIRTFLSELPRRVSSILEGLRLGDLSQIKRAAHTLGSTSALLGAHGISQICTALRDVDDIPSASTVVGRLELEAQDVADAFAIRLKQHGDSA
ncbi:MAG: response regulator, partial [Acidimicrobiia bacterium]|nr:response regulator [Acidimicrobiia bacterium]